MRSAGYGGGLWLALRSDRRRRCEHLSPSSCTLVLEKGLFSEGCRLRWAGPSPPSPLLSQSILGLEVREGGPGCTSLVSADTSASLSSQGFQKGLLELLLM